MSKTLIQSLSGTRAVIGDTFHPSIALETAMAFGSWAGKGPVIVGTDSRTSRDMLKGAVLSGLTAVGIDVIDIGIVPTPTVQQMIRYYNAAAGIVVTASHNPIIWNGLKLMNSTGSFLDAEEYDRFQTILNDKSYILATWDKIGKVTIDNKALNRHIDIIFEVVDPKVIQESNLSVVVDPNNGAGCEADRLLLDQLGVDYTIINGEANGHFSHSPEPVKDNLDQIRKVMKEGRFDIGFVQDADADRLVIFDETGHFIGEDYSLAFGMDHILAQTGDSDKSVVVNLSTSKVIEQLADKHGATLTYTKIGESFVTQGIKSQNATVGGEGNGGIIYPKVGWGRDSLAGIVIALQYLAMVKKSVSDIVSTYPQYVMIRNKFSVSTKEEVTIFLNKMKAAFSSEKLITDDGVKVDFGDRWIHARPSNTEPIVRLFTEAPTEEEARELIARLESV